jgi:S1-C subfamily serine protease
VTQSPPTPDLFAALSRASADLAAASAASTVQVHGRPRRPASGIVVAPERVVTTSHSVEWEDGVRVRTPEGEDCAAEVAGHAAGVDVVLLRVPGLSAPPLAASTDPVRAGALVIVAGRAWSGNPHVRLVTVSGVGGPLRAGDGTRIEQVFGLPVSPYPGVSGSAVLDATGGLAGLATAGILRGRVVGLPAPALQTLVDTLESKGTLGRGFLGVTTQPVRLTAVQASQAGQEQGLVIVGVAPDSPAAKAGLFVGDVLLAADGAGVLTAEDLLAALGPERVDRPLRLRVLRGTAAVDTEVTVGARPRRW